VETSEAPALPADSLDFPITVHGQVVVIVRASCHCGGDYAWMRLRDSGAWEMAGCVCHNPALGV
jgi:hypothetical protein